jgi:hypothetical protein
VTLTITRVTSSSATTTSVTSATCPTNSIVLSANCGCSNAGGTRNFGVLFVCEVAGNGGVVGCFVDASYNPNLPAPRGDIAIECLGGHQLDGTPLFVSIGAKAAQEAGELDDKAGEIRQSEQAHTAASQRH